jgi:hypothetical protein
MEIGVYIDRVKVKLTLCFKLDRRLARPQSRSGRGGYKKNSQTLPGIEP